MDHTEQATPAEQEIWEREPSPGELAQMETDWPKRPAGLELDPHSAVTRYLMSFPTLAASIAAIGQEMAEPLIAPKTQRLYERYFENFRRYCEHTKRPSPEDLTDEALGVAMLEWVQWRAEPCESTHPLVIKADKSETGAKTGERKPEPMKNLKHLKGALLWWLEANGLDIKIADAASVFAKKHDADAEPSKPARGLTDDEYKTIVDVLLDGKIVTSTNPAVTEAWHIVMLAQIAFAVAGSARTGEPALLHQDNLIEATDEKLVFTEPGTKTGERTFTLDARSDVLCPVWNLHRLVDFCNKQKWDRDGWIFPTVRLNRPLSDPLSKPSVGQVCVNWNRVAVAADVRQVEGSELLATAHTHRSTLICRAITEGDWSDIDKLQLGGWKSLATAAGYADRNHDPHELVGQLAADIKADA
jgi:integrase